MDVDETTAERYQRELIELTTDMVDGKEPVIDSRFAEQYLAFAQVLISATNAYISLRIVEELIEGES